MMTSQTPRDTHFSRADPGRADLAKAPDTWQEWLPQYAAEFVFSPRRDDDKYRRGVVGLVTGSTQYPGAALLGTSAAVRSGVGMVRYVGPPATGSMVLLRRPEVVLGRGRVSAWVLGSGVPTDKETTQQQNIDAALDDGVPVVVDAGAIPRAAKRTNRFEPHPYIFTPHAGELAAMLTTIGYPTSRRSVEADPRGYALVSAQLVSATVLLKGKVTVIANQDGTALTVSSAPAVLATAGTGDVLAALLGGLLATATLRIDTDRPDNLAMLAATAAYIHGRAASRASKDGAPIAADDLATHIPAVIAEILARS